MNDFFQFDFMADGDAKEISTPVFLSKPDVKSEPVKCNAVWDTGATSSMISSAAAKKLALAPVGMIQIAGVHGISNAKCYYVDISFGNGFALHKIKVSEAYDFGGFDLLVGMDIIAKGILFMDGVTDGNTFHVRFQIPIEFHE